MKITEDSLLDHWMLSLACLIAILSPRVVQAQVGDYRNALAVGVNGGYLLSSVAFSPRVPQTMQGGLTGGLTLRYTSEKYFNSICAIVAEVNYAQTGWKESIRTNDDQPVVNQQTGVAEEYTRRTNYIQVPVLARLGWGRERQGFQFYFQIGPQMGFLLSESTHANFDLQQPNSQQRASHVSGPDIDGHPYSNMYQMPVENKFDYGIAGGFGLEFSQRHLGHFLLDARYYFGLGNVYGNTKSDYFGKSNFSNITVKLAYIFDITKTNNPKIK